MQATPERQQAARKDICRTAMPTSPASFVTTSFTSSAFSSSSSSADRNCMSRRGDEVRAQTAKLNSMCQMPLCPPLEKPAPQELRALAQARRQAQAQRHPPVCRRLPCETPSAMLCACSCIMADALKPTSSTASTASARTMGMKLTGPARWENRPPILVLLCLDADFSRCGCDYLVGDGAPKELHFVRPTTALPLRAFHACAQIAGVNAPIPSECAT